MRLTSVRPARRPGRPGFTLIELLVVITIIIALASLVLGAVFNLRESQMKSFTETTVQKLASALDQQMKAVIDQVRDETTPAWALTMAGGDTRRARVIFIKSRLKQEFPVTFYQAKYPFATDQGRYVPDPSGANPLVTAGNMPPKASYLTALQNVPLPAPPQSGALPAVQEVESSALLFLALNQGRRGVSANIEDLIEPTAIQTRQYQLANGAKIDFRVFVDSWGNPLRFYTFPTGNDELNDKPYVNTDALMLAQFPPKDRDPQDPEGTLYSLPAVWPALKAGTKVNYRAQFQRLIHPLQSNTTAPVTARYLTPVVASAGRDGAWGIDPVTMAVIPTAAGDANDNIYSYRLRQTGARGD